MFNKARAAEIEAMYQRNVKVFAGKRNFWVTCERILAKFFDYQRKRWRKKSEELSRGEVTYLHFIEININKLSKVLRS